MCGDKGRGGDGGVSACVLKVSRFEAVHLKTMKTFVHTHEVPQRKHFLVLLQKVPLDKRSLTVQIHGVIS